ncbi:MAG: hypothetical protein D6739_00680 [Nitrospirae bacterium]|nr:MAG: hypothetical protein D6739_00680 [Nitrospirota bacterium]
MARFILAALLLLTALPAAAGDPAGQLPDAARERARAEAALKNPKVQELGGGRFRVGLIQVDRKARRFAVPAVVHQVEGPQEFVLATHGGYKGYESTLEAGATAYEFNVACLLIGLDPERAGRPRYHFDPNHVQGDAVAVSVVWRDAKGEHRIDARQAVVDRRSGKTLGPSPWIYTGSTLTPDGTYLAQSDGVLIGFVHDPAEIITLRDGTGQSDYGNLVPNRALLPPKGTRVTVEVQALTEKPKGKR